MRWTLFMLTFFLIVLLVFGGGVYYQSFVKLLTYELYAPSIHSFRNIQWGAPPEKIFNKYGSLSLDTATIQPILENQNPPGKIVRYSKVTINGKEATIEFIFHPKKGLVKGLYYLPFGRGNDCLRVFDQFLEKYRKKYELINPKLVQENQLNVKFCHAVLVGKAKKIAQWSDPYSNAMITLGMGWENQNNKEVTLIVESPEYYQWNQ